jgi:hypothetical protein
VQAHDYALSPGEFLRSIAASRDTLGKVQMRLIDVVADLRVLTGDAPYAVVGGLAQILWARKTHTDDLDVVLAADDLSTARTTIESGHAAARWTLPKVGEPSHEADEIFEVQLLLCDGSVVDLIAFANATFNEAILSTAREVPELGGTRFISPELLLVTHLLRPGPQAAVAAVELVLARRERGFDLEQCRLWAERVGKGVRFARTLELAKNFELE